MSKHKRNNLKLDPNDHNILNNLKSRNQWLQSKSSFIGEVSDEEWFMISDYLFRLSLDYTAFMYNKQTDPKKKEERLSNVTRCADTLLKMVGLKYKEEEFNNEN